MLKGLYEESEVVRIEHEAREEAARICEEDARSKEERRNLYNEEVRQTIDLENEALDFEKACFFLYHTNLQNINKCQCFVINKDYNGNKRQYTKIVKKF